MTHYIQLPYETHLVTQIDTHHTLCVPPQCQISQQTLLHLLDMN